MKLAVPVSAVTVLVDMGSQTGFARLLQASTTTEAFVAHEIVNWNRLLCTPKDGSKFKIWGFGRNQKFVDASDEPNAEENAAQPVVPGR